VARHVDLTTSSTTISSRDQKLREKLAAKGPGEKVGVSESAKRQAEEKKGNRKDTTRMKKLLLDLKKNGLEVKS
jgi:hypothetical protein